MALDKATLQDRIAYLLGLEVPAGDSAGMYETVVEVFQGALTVAQALYGAGEETPHVQTLMKAAQKAREKTTAISHAFYINVFPAARGSLRAMQADLESGLVGTIERRATGEVLADMLGLAKEAMAEGSDGSKNVAAVLAAAAYEDTIRRMGATVGSVQGRPDLADVLTALKKADVLGGAPLTTAQGYLKFRNDALHADWTKLDHAVVGSCIAFVEGLVLQHLS